MKHRQKGRTRARALNRDGHIIGLDLGATAVRATVLEPCMVDGRRSVTVHGMGRIGLAPGVLVNGVVQEPGALTVALKQLWHENKFAGNRVVLGIANQQVLVRDITIPDLDPAQRAKALPFQAREVVALPIDQVVLDFCQLGDADPETNLMRGLLLATPREPVLVAVSAVERAGLTVGRVDLSSFGSLRSLADEEPAVEAIIDLGAHLTTIMIHDHGVPKLVRTLARGGQQLTEQLADRMDISQQEAEAAKCDVDLDDDLSELTRMVNEALRPLLAEIRTSVQYFRSSNTGTQIERISLTGGGASLRGMATRLREQIGLPTGIVDPTQHIGNQHSPKHAALGHGVPDFSAVSIGLAMGAAA
jgi:type IV pilus assembly protein PilM